MSDDLGASDMLHLPSIDRVRNVVKNDTEGEGMVAIMTSLAAEAALEGNEVGQCCVAFLEEADKFKEDTWVPELWIVVRKVIDDEA